jgi:two-component sensor histidine kinase
MTVQDITELVEKERNLAEMAQFPSDSPDPILRIDASGRILYANAAAKPLLDFWQTAQNAFIPLAEIPHIQSALSKDETICIDVDVYGRYYNFVLYPVMPQKYVNAYGRDITTLNETLSMIESALADKTVLIQEIHHRVKNNMQIIMSMLKLQRFNTEDNECKKLLLSTINRVKSMAIVHEKTYDSEDIALVNIPGFVISLVSLLQRTFIHINRQVHVQYNIQIQDLNLNASVPFGLILNEVVSNVLQHAFIGMPEGEMIVTLTKIGEEYLLEVRDNGLGFDYQPADVGKQSMGMLLINTLVKQLHGTMRLYRDRGTVFELRFKNV